MICKIYILYNTNRNSVMSSLYSDLNHNLSSDLTMFQEQISLFATSEIAPLAEEIDKKGQIPKYLWTKMGKMGLLGITVDENHGGSNAGYLAHVIAMETISAASASVGLSYGAHSNLCVNQIYRNGSGVQKEKYLPALVSGDHIGALAMSEVSSGSDVISMKLSAKEKSDHFILNGSKMWITNGPDADIIVTYAKTSPDKGAKGITAFIIEKSFDGFCHAQKLDKLGMRGSSTSELVFNNCIVPKENILGELNQGVKVLMSGLDYERVVLAAGPVGIMKACMDISLSYSHERKQFDEPIGNFQLIQGKLADMYTALSSSRAHLYAVAKACDNNRISRKDAAAVILNCSEKATAIALETIQILGGNGYINDYPAGRFLRDAKLYEIGAGTSEIRRMLIGRELFKESGGA